jgi:hypothetical protein
MVLVQFAGWLLQPHAADVVRFYRVRHHFTEGSTGCSIWVGGVSMVRSTVHHRPSLVISSTPRYVIDPRFSVCNQPAPVLSIQRCSTTSHGSTHIRPSAQPRHQSEHRYSNQSASIHHLSTDRSSCPAFPIKPRPRQSPILISQKIPKSSHHKSSAPPLSSGSSQQQPCPAAAREARAWARAAPSATGRCSATTSRASRSRRSGDWRGGAA